MIGRGRTKERVVAGRKKRDAWGRVDEMRGWVAGDLRNDTSEKLEDSLPSLGFNDRA